MVLGHLGYDDFGLRIGRMIYSFHMPAFVFLSGYLTSLNADLKKKLNWILTTLAIYIVAQWGQCLYSFLVPLYSHGELGPLHWKSILGLSPCFAMWYILSLIYWRIGIWLAQGRVNDGALLLLSCIGAVLSGCVPINGLSFQRTFVFMPMFVVGYLLRKYEKPIVPQRIPFWGSAVFLAFGFALSRHLPTFLPAICYDNIKHDMLVRVVQSVLSVFLTCGVMRVLQELPVEKLARWGRYTLWVYIGHTVPMFVQNAVLHKFGITLNAFTAIPLAACYVICLSVLAEKYYKARNDYCR